MSQARYLFGLSLPRNNAGQGWWLLVGLPLMVAKWEGEEVRWAWSLGLIDANYCIWSE